MSGADWQSDRPVRLVTVARAFSLQEADVIRAVLGGHGIDCFVQGELAANTLAYLGVGLNPGGIQVLVRECDASQAAEVLDRCPARAEAPPAQMRPPPEEAPGSEKDKEITPR